MRSVLQKEISYDALRREIGDLPDLKRLLELGLGIDRRLRETGTDPERGRLPESEVSF